MLQAGFVVGNRLSKLTASERERLLKLAARVRWAAEHGSPRRSARNSARSPAKLDVRGMSGELLPLFRGGRGRHGRRS